MIIVHDKAEQEHDSILHYRNMTFSVNACSKCNLCLLTHQQVSLISLPDPQNDFVHPPSTWRHFFF